MLDLKLTIKQTIPVLRAAIRAREPVLLISQPGIGKSAACQLAAELEGARFVLEHGPIASPEDSKGIAVPQMDKRIAEWFPFGNLAILRDATTPEKKVVCLLDDLGQAHQSVQKAYMQWVHARRIGDIEIGKYVTFLAATNGRGHKSGVTGLISALGSRFATRISVKSDFRAWAEWYLQQPGLPVSVPVFLQWNREYFSDEYFSKHISLDPEKATPNCRTYHALGRMVKVLEGAAINNGTALAVYAGTVGEEVAVQFQAFLTVFKKLPHPDEFMRNPDTATTFSDSDIAERWAVCSMLMSQVKRGDNDTFERASRYIVRLPEEFQFFWFTQCPKMRKLVMNTSTYVKWSIAHQDAMK